MKKFNSLKFFFSCFFLFIGMGLYAQQITVTGIVLDGDTKEGAPFANVVVKGTQTGVSTDINGKFELTTNNEKLPFTLVVSYTGFVDEEVEVTENNQNISVSLKTDAVIIGEGVVVSASRQPERILESPVSVERMDTRMIKNTPSASFYDAIENLKGVQMNTNSLTFKSVNTRGFATFANVRFVQLIDGMDNAAPGLNFPAGNLVGISELDVQNVELVPGAASALYGPNAFNGILFMNSKDPYLQQGLTAMVRTGLTVQDDIVINEDPSTLRDGTNGFGEFAIRFAEAFGAEEKLGIKLNFSYLKGTDWYANDYSDMDQNGINAGNRGVGSSSYDGVNIYGDEIATTVDVDAVAQQIIGFSLGLPPIRVARTGYREVDLVEYNAESIKGDVAVHYKISDKIEILGNYRFGLGSSVYQGANRYSLDNIRLHQAKAEVKGDNFFLRYYTTIEEAGGSWDTRFAAWNINRAWKGDVEWFTQYTEGYLGTLIMGCPGAVPGTPAFDACSLVAHANGRALADQGRLVPGTPEFETERERITDLADLRNGSRFIDKTTLQHVEGNYNFNELIDFVDLQVGANWRMYRLNSEGTIFTDSEAQGGPIPISEFGAYVQAGKKLLPKDRLKLLASARYDKNQNFEGRISPRASFVFSLGENREHNVRGSFQTGFRNPDTQAQYIGLDLGVATLVGGAEENIERYSLIVPYSDAQGNLVETTVLGPSIYSNSYTASSATAYSAAVAASIAQGVDPGTAAVINAGILETASSIEFIKPERITSYEIGYKGVIERKLLLDVNFYYNQYRDFQANTNVVHVLTGDVNDMTTFSGVQDLGAGRTRVFQLYSNATGKVTSRGVGVSLDYSLPMNFIAGASWSHNRLDIDESADPNLIPGFNTPEHRINLKIGNRNIADTNISFMLNWRWLDNYRWEASFGNGDVDSYSVLDAQISYDIPNANTTIKLGGSNILNQSYRQAFGAAPVGAQYFISLTYNGVK